MQIYKKGYFVAVLGDGFHSGITECEKCFQLEMVGLGCVNADTLCLQEYGLPGNHLAGETP